MIALTLITHLLASMPASPAAARTEAPLSVAILRLADGLRTAAEELARARLPEPVASQVLRLVGRTVRCIQHTEHVIADVTSPWERALEAPPGRHLSRHAAQISACGSKLELAARRAGAALMQLSSEGVVARIDLWPLLRVDTRNRNNVYEHDYAILIDGGGNDTYLNSAGGNLLDLRRGPAGSPAPAVAPARGCQHVGDIATLTRVEIRTNPDCIPAAAVLVDVAGDDTYGRLEAPDPSVDGM